MKTVGTIEVRRWSREEYEKMIDTGIFPPDARAELIEGEIFTMTPQKGTHAAAICATEEALRSALGFQFNVRSQLPLALGSSSEPEPDVSVVPGSWRDYRDAHPSSADLVVEIADTSLEYDRDRKGSLYARAGIVEYWIVNLSDKRLEVYRDPVKSSGATFGWTYGTVRHYAPDDRVAPLAAADKVILVNDLLP